jgi:type II secretory pathway component PulF
LKSSGYFPPAVTNLILVGYASGDLPGMLKKAAAMCDREVERTTQVMTRLLEPALIFILGGVVGLVVAGILLPVFRINVLVR